MNWKLRYSEINRLKQIGLFKPIQHGADVSITDKKRCADERRQNGLSGQCEKCMVRTKSTETIEHGPNASKSQKERCRQERKSMGEPGLCDECSIGNKTRNEIQENGEIHRVSYSPNGKETSRSRIEADGTKSFWEGRVPGKNGRSNNLKVEAIKYWEDQDDGKHVCQICNQTPQEKYGNESNLKRFPMHHLRPLNTYPEGGGFTNVKELIPACRSCHDEILHELGTHNQATTLENARNRFQQHKQIKIEEKRKYLDAYKNGEIDDDEFLKRISKMNWELRYAGVVIPMGYTRGKDFICHRHITFGDLRHNGFQPSFKQHKPEACPECAIEIEKTKPKESSLKESRYNPLPFLQLQEEAEPVRVFPPITTPEQLKQHELLHHGGAKNFTDSLVGHLLNPHKFFTEKFRSINRNVIPHVHSENEDSHQILEKYNSQKKEAIKTFRGITGGEYDKARRVAEHDEIMDYKTTYPSGSLAQYRKARRGETHKDVMDMLGLGINIENFVTNRWYRGNSRSLSEYVDGWKKRKKYQE